MNTPRVTIAIPTYKRPELLQRSIRSALAQTYADFQVLVVDNASNDRTAEVVKSFGAPRLHYHCNAANVGMLGNFNRILALNQSPFLTILLDDDELGPAFLQETMRVMEAHPSVSLVLTWGRYIDMQGAVLRPDHIDLPAGVIAGLDYLERSAGKRHGGAVSTCLIRASALAATEGFDSPHGMHATDFRLFTQLARAGDVAFIKEELAYARLHPNQESELLWGNDRLGMENEYLDVVALLLESERAGSPAYRQWLARRIRQLNARLSEQLCNLRPKLALPWPDRLRWAVEEIDRLIPANGRFILVNDQQWDPATTHPRHRPLPFLEKDGNCWGPPADDETAIRELERMRGDGAKHLVFAWPSFWWMEFFPRFREYVYRHYPTLAETPRLRIFDLTTRAEAPASNTVGDAP